MPDTVGFNIAGEGTEISRNILRLGFPALTIPATAFSYSGSTPLANTDTASVEWVLTYTGNAGGQLPLTGEDTKERAPVQTLRMLTTINQDDGTAVTTRIYN